MHFFLPCSSFGISFAVFLLPTGPLGEHLVPACLAWLLFLDILASCWSSWEAVAVPLPLEELGKCLAQEMGICCLLGQTRAHTRGSKALHLLWHDV